MTANSQLAYLVRGLELVRGNCSLLSQAQLAIEAGGATAIVGANGTGKTSLLKFLAFLLSMPFQEFWFFGIPVCPNPRDWGSFRLQVTYIGQVPYLFRGSVWDNVAFGLSVRGPVDSARVNEALRQVGVQHLASRNAQRLSGGEAQRVAWARALALDPPVYLLDEPTANVDRDFVGVLEEIVTELVARGRTVVFSTHSVAQAYRLASRVLSLGSNELLPFPLLNAWPGEVVRSQGELLEVAVGGVRLIAATGTVANGKCLATVDPENILLAREPLRSSARNCLPGAVTRVEGDASSHLVFVDCGVLAAARLTTAAVRELQLTVGTPVYVIFKASAVHLLSRPAMQREESRGPAQHGAMNER